MGDGCGFKYRRNSAEGSPSTCLGRISLVKMGDSKARVRKSSGGILGAVKLEKDLAADLMACNDAVRFDLNDLNRSVDGGNNDAILAISDDLILSVSSASEWSNGWSATQSSVGGDEIILSLRSVTDVRRKESGVLRLSHWEK